MKLYLIEFGYSIDDTTGKSYQNVQAKSEAEAKDIFTESMKDSLLTVKFVNVINTLVPKNYAA